tara:strand:- start:118 stop:1098 length:981 start_codon:yes stop_codon:yes gene_type:complete
LTDNGSGQFEDRAIDIVGFSELYAFTSHTFTNAGATGRYGPTLSDLTTGSDAYSPDWTDSTNNLNVTTQGIQEWTVPQTGSYTIKAAGAAGAGAHPSYLNTAAFRGIEMQGTFTLTKGVTVRIIVGQMGLWVNSGGGGGGSFVYYNATDTYPILAAGGGGGIDDWNNATLSPSVTTYSPGAFTDGQSGTSGGANSQGQSGGTNGGGGAGHNYGSGGAGWLTDGADAYHSQGTGGGHAPRNDGTGGVSQGGAVAAQGGFGGGGSTHGNTGGAGAGGGYSGGVGVTGGLGYGAGGGGSYGGSATGVYNAAGGSGQINGGHGYVVITKN